VRSKLREFEEKPSAFSTFSSLFLPVFFYFSTTSFDLKKRKGGEGKEKEEGASI